MEPIRQGAVGVLITGPPRFLPARTVYLGFKGSSSSPAGWRLLILIYSPFLIERNVKKWIDRERERDGGGDGSVVTTRKTEGMREEDEERRWDEGS